MQGRTALLQEDRRSQAQRLSSVARKAGCKLGLWKAVNRCLRVSRNTIPPVATMIRLLQLTFFATKEPMIDDRSFGLSSESTMDLRKLDLIRLAYRAR